jgi:hypothetical protein
MLGFGLTRAGDRGRQEAIRGRREEGARVRSRPDAAGGREATLRRRGGSDGGGV